MTVIEIQELIDTCENEAQLEELYAQLDEAYRLEEEENA